MIKLNTDDGLGVPFSSETRSSSFRGKRFAPAAVIKTKPKEPEIQLTPLFPAKLNVVGVTKGPMWCESCKIEIPDNSKICETCMGSFIVSLRQKYLNYAQRKELTVCSLKREPQNPFDNKAVGVWIRWTDGSEKQIGYLPAKAYQGEDGLSLLTASDFFDMLDENKQFWILAFITGGPKEGKSNMSYGCRLTIYDKPPI